MKVIRKRYFLLAGVLFVLLVSCQKQQEEAGEAGTLISSTLLQDYDSGYVRGLIHTIASIRDLPLKYNVSALRIVYLTHDPKGKIVKASGLVVVPADEGVFPLLSIQHGTILKRTEVSSFDPMLNEGILGIIAASEGYVVSIPDYLGLGISNIMHPYLIREVLAGNVADMLKAVREYMQTRGMGETGQLFLAGYSEGGYVTMALHHYLENTDPLQGLTVTASAPMAGPYDLIATLDTILSYHIYHSPAFIAYVLSAYDTYYGWDMVQEVFREPYASLIPALYDGTHTGSEVNNSLTEDLAELINPEFLEDYQNGREEELVRVLWENSIPLWRAAAPVRLYHGDNDHTVPYVNALLMRERLLKEGSEEVTLVTVHGGDHYTSQIPSFTGSILWFDSLRVNR